MTSTEASSKVERAYHLIRRRILDGSYTPGYRLVLSTLAKELGVSTVPVREAVRRLEAESLVEVVRNVGAAVRGLDPAEYRWTAETLAIVESAATGLAAEHLDAAALGEAHRLNAAMREGLADLDPMRHSRLNQQFHHVLIATCPNPHLLELVHREWARMATLRATVFSFVPDRARESVDEHDTLLALIERHAPPADIEAMVRRHREHTVRAVLNSQEGRG
ncbi:GntR family transcriptional regulator [Pseudonocardia eucalypti]|uniref:GntR family transcriptional regulator n=1 Tax=Pseudonocardia eucalypti TaxID=648755 RepID=A0ABP9QQZ2_9PSEU|nr:DNA-binding GntR family transcriptional regulator [Pseudonocardia eucalypti]